MTMLDKTREWGIKDGRTTIRWCARPLGCADYFSLKNALMVEPSCAVIVTW